MITIKNNVRKVKTKVTVLKKDAQAVLSALKYPDYDLTILLTTNKTVHKYNRQFRNKDKPTDILSFPYYPELKAGERIKPEDEDEKVLGDLIISPEYVQKDAISYNQTYDERLQMLLVHGILHLLGYDHIKDEEYEVMNKQEKKLLKYLKTRD